MGLWAAIKYLLDRTIGGYEVFNSPGLHTFVPPKGIFIPLPAEQAAEVEQAVQTGEDQAAEVELR